MLISALVIPTTPGLAEVVIFDNKCFGHGSEQVWDAAKQQWLYPHDIIDKDQSGWSSLCEAMKSSGIQKLGFADIGIGPIGMKTLAETISTIPGVVEVVISANKCFGEKLKYEDSPHSGTIHDVDNEQSGWSALCGAVKGAGVQKLGFANIGLGPIGMKTLAETIPTIPGLTEVVLYGNPITDNDIIQLKASAPNVSIKFIPAESEEDDY
eukprot:SAG11_NODE_540_length_8654_cov_9.626110_6_plen_210_part_00